jgi:hypothetical protein
MVAAGDPNPYQLCSALVDLCRHYGYPLYAYLRRRGYQAEEAQDLTQEFFFRILEGKCLDRADLGGVRAARLQSPIPPQ